MVNIGEREFSRNGCVFFSLEVDVMLENEFEYLSVFGVFSFWWLVYCEPINE